jgi:hypothetical protein
MKDLFYQGGPGFMGALTILLIITTAWIVYHFVVASKSQHSDKENMLLKIGWGKSIGLFALIIGILGQMIGLSNMFSAIEAALQRGEEIIPAIVFAGIKATMICTIYGILIYLFSLILWFVASLLIKNKFKFQ